MYSDRKDMASLGSDSNEDTRTYSVVINDEEQYSIWPADREIPAGWRAVGKVGSKADCLEYIETVWTDMRPLSLRKWMDEHGEEGQSGSKDDKA
jgi:MbtH protein